MQKIKKYLVLLGSVLALVFTGCNDIDYANYVYPPAEDKTALEALIADCQELVSGAEIGNLKGQYLDYVVNNFEKAISDARTVLGNDKATQEIVDNAVSTLTTSKNIFVESVNVADLDANDGSLVLHLRFSGNIYDGSPIGHKVVGKQGHKAAGAGPAPTFTTDRYGIEGQAIHMEDGGHISIPYTDGKSQRLSPSAVTIMFWIREPERAACQRWICSYDTYNICFLAMEQNSNEIFFGGSSKRTPYFKFIQSGINTSANWMHVAMTYGLEKVRFYMNGELALETDSYGYLQNSEAKRPYLIGAMVTSDEGFEDWGYTEKDHFPLHFDGDLDEFRFYDKELDADAVWSVFNIEKPDNMQVDRSGLAAAIEAATEVRETSVEGYKTGEFLPAVMTEFESQIESAREMLDNSVATQNQLDRKAVEITAQAEAFKALANTRDFNPNIVLNVNCNGQIVDESFLAHKLQFVNGLTNLPPYPAIDRFGKYDGAVHFDKGSYISIPKKNELVTDELTYMFWIKAAAPPIVGSDTYLMSINRRFRFYVGLKDDKFILGGVNENKTLREKTTDATVSSEWQHIAVTYSKTDGVRMYVNGVETFSNPVTGALAPVEDEVPFVIGVKGSSDYTKSYFRGDLDEILAFDRPLSALEIDEIYQQQK